MREPHQKAYNYGNNIDGDIKKNDQLGAWKNREQNICNKQVSLKETDGPAQTNPQKN